jgi:hypothetical protein
MLDPLILAFVAVGFGAQIIDGALGMGYGVISTTILLGMGIQPVAASASVHTAEIFTTAASGLSHFRYGNVDKTLFMKLLIPGAIGGITGAYILTTLPGERIKPFVAIYLFAMGIVIFIKALKHEPRKPSEIKPVPLAAFGGFMDAIGGGGWGPIVTSTIVARGHEPRLAIGSVNAAEFFVTVAQCVTFSLGMGTFHWKIILGLLIGGVAAAPLAAYICNRAPTRFLMTAVGIAIMILSVRTVYLAHPEVCISAWLGIQK